MALKSVTNLSISRHLALITHDATKSVNSSISLRQHHAKIAKKRKTLQTCGKAYGNACFAG